METQTEIAISARAQCQVQICEGTPYLYSEGKYK